MKNQNTIEEEFKLLDIVYRKILQAEAYKRLISSGFEPSSIQTYDVNQELEAIHTEYGHFDNAIQNIIEACNV